MPEGPSIVILKEQVQEFKGRRIISVSGNTKIDKDRLLNQKITDFKSWGKHFLVCFKDFTLKVHFMLFGSYRINEEKNAIPRLSLKFKKGFINFYSCLLDQNIFAGSGNIIKNEVLFRIKMHPLSVIGKLPAKQLNLLINETRNYAFDFLEWKKKYELRKHWLAHTQKICPRCNIPFIKNHLGKYHRRSFYCDNCQLIYE